MATSSTPKHDGDGSGGSRKGRLRRRLPIIGAAVLAEAIPVWRHGYGVGGNVIVRCRDGHLFTTMWVPGASVKSLRFGPRRFQWCPVGHHWSLVSLVRKSDLSARQQRSASKTKDIRIP